MAGKLLFLFPVYLTDCHIRRFYAFVIEFYSLPLGFPPQAGSPTSLLGDGTRGCGCLKNFQPQTKS